MKRFIRFVRRPRAGNPQRVSRKVNDFLADGKLEKAGTLAYESGLPWALGISGSQKYADLLAKKNPYAAIEVWKNIPGKSPLKGVEYYLKAFQPHKAELIVENLTSEEITTVSSLFARYYANHENKKEFERWSKFISPNLATSLRRTFKYRRRLDPHTSKLIACLNQAIVEQCPEILDDIDVYAIWQAFLLNPTDHRRALNLCTCLREKGVELPFADLFRNLNVREACILLSILPSCRPGWFASIARRCNPSELRKLMEDCDVSTKYSPEGLASIANVDPELLSKLDITCLGSHPDIPEHVLAALWRIHYRPEWLFSLTMKRVRSYSLLTNAAETLIREKEWSKLEMLFHEFVKGKNLSIPPRLLEGLVEFAGGIPTKRLKLPPPQPANVLEEWERAKTVLKQIEEAVP